MGLHPPRGDVLNVIQIIPVILRQPIVDHVKSADDAPIGKLVGHEVHRPGPVDIQRYFGISPGYILAASLADAKCRAG